MAPRIRALSKEHDIAGFDCGVPELNQWLRTTAMQHQRSGTSKTFVIEDESHASKIAGFVTMAIRSLVPTDALPPSMQRRLPHQVPGFTLARLAVAREFKGRGIGAYLLMEAMERSWRAAQHVGGFALFVDAKGGAVSFYEKFGFVPLPGNPHILVLPINSMPAFRPA